MKIAFATSVKEQPGTIVATVEEDRRLSAPAAELDEATNGVLTRAMANSRFKGKKGELLEVLAPAGLKAGRILLAGLGKPTDLKDRDLEDLGGSVVAKLNALGEKAAWVRFDGVGEDKDRDARAAHLAFGALLRGYRFDKYRTKEKAEEKPSLKTLTLVLKSAQKAKRAYQALEKTAEGVFLTRNVVSEPGNIIYPKSFVAEAKKLEKLGVEIEVLGEKEMKKLGMGALLGVAQGSTREPQLLVMRWNGTPKNKKAPKPFMVVGKGVTFDSGGISIKPAGGMEDMKWDMGGAGTVLGLMKALAGRKAKAHVVGICGLVENMPDGNAQRPGDIVTSMSGQTIEVINTDAEGRLVLADALWYGQEKYEPRAVVDLATLTGAIIISLGHEYAGLFSNNDELSERLTAAGEAVDEKLWRLPLGEAFDKAINTDAADMKNVGNRAGGSITAAQFLQRFIKGKTPWAHLDIAGMAWADKAKPTVPKGATAFGVRLLDRLVAEHYET